MARFVKLPASRALLLVNATARLALFCALLGTICSIAAAQTYTQGLPTVGNSTPTAAPSQMFIDATQSNGTDMCAKIANACAQLGFSTSYPIGATIDARGFIGNQVCAAGNITTMLFKCVPQGSSTGATSGKLLLGEVNLYADGPTLNPYYTDGSSKIGTPALIIPSFFWGIEGVSRGCVARKYCQSSATGAGHILVGMLRDGQPHQ